MSRSRIGLEHFCRLNISGFDARQTELLNFSTLCTIFLSFLASSLQDWPRLTIENHHTFTFKPNLYPHLFLFLVVVYWLQTLVYSLNSLLKCEIGGLECWFYYNRYWANEKKKITEYVYYSTCELYTHVIPIL